MSRALFLVLTVLGVSVSAQSSLQSAPSVLFICEHGAAKSLIATAYFNKLATDRGLPYRATFRGTAPQEALSTRAVEGLQADKVPVPSGKPTAIASADITRATHIFAIGCALPANVVASGKSNDWTDVPDDQGYVAMRDAIVRHVTAPRRPPTAATLTRSVSSRQR